MHKDMICKKSDFFTAACSSAWAEGKEGVVRLPTIEPETVKLYIHWVYSGDVDLEVFDSTEAKRQFPNSIRPADAFASTQLLRLHVAADMLLDRSLGNRVIDRIIEMMEKKKKWLVNQEVLELVWTHTKDGSKLRQCILDFFAAEVPSTSFRIKGRSLSKDFIFDLAIGQMELRDTPSRDICPTVERKCRYHEHSEGEAACG